MSSVWQCSGDPEGTDDDYYDNYDCYVTFDLFSYRHIKQVRIGKR